MAGCSFWFDEMTPGLKSFLDGLNHGMKHQDGSRKAVIQAKKAEVRKAIQAVAEKGRATWGRPQ